MRDHHEVGDRGRRCCMMVSRNDETETVDAQVGE